MDSQFLLFAAKPRCAKNATPRLPAALFCQIRIQIFAYSSRVTGTHGGTVLRVSTRISSPLVVRYTGNPLKSPVCLGP